MKTPKYLCPGDYMADPSANVFNGRLYIYPSHDWESGIPENDNGDHFNMKDYHVFSTDDIEGEALPVDHGVILDTADIPWAGRQLWDNDVVEKDGKYYLIFSLKDKCDVFHLGVAVADRPEGPFKPMADPIKGSYSIDPCAFKDDDGQVYVYFGGLWGGQLQRYRDNKHLECARLQEGAEPALPSRVARMRDDMMEFAEEPQPVIIVDAEGKPLRADDPHRFFEASWMHKYQGKYYFSYSTGDSHLLCYAIGDSPYGPFTFGGEILTPVVGWTTHHSIVEFKGKWYLFHHDSVPSGDRTWLRSMKVVEIEYTEDGHIKTIQGTQE
ncbi:MAG: glycoside hydrolase family 43 protein [Bacteroidaceae bacterium]|nr:glycoside hydrolase family 43 protein [Bacteroidaceae bacterium]